MKMCEFANNLADMAYMAKLIIKKVDIRVDTMDVNFPLLGAEMITYYYKFRHRLSCLVLEYELNYFFIDRKPSEPEIVLFIW